MIGQKFYINRRSGHDCPPAGPASLVRAVRSVLLFCSVLRGRVWKCYSTSLGMSCTADSHNHSRTGGTHMRVWSSLLVSLVFALYAPLGAAGAGTPRSAAGTSPCDEPAQIHAELERLHGADFATLPREERNKKVYAAFIELLSKHPMDVHVHRSYQDFLSRGYEEKLDEARTRYLHLLEQSPDSALYLYLVGRMRVEEEPDVARQHFEKAAAKDSSWPWPHLGLAYLYSRNGPLGDPEKLDMEVSALLSLCPTSDASFTYLSEVRNPEVKRRASM